MLGSDDPDLSLSIPLLPLFEECCCPICFNFVKDCHITVCGHIFCGSCIRECLNRKHCCPCCNHEMEAKQLVRNFHFDRLVSVIMTQKELASKRYFEKLIKSGEDSSEGIPLEYRYGTSCNEEMYKRKADKDNRLSPIEELFRRHMNKNLNSYEDYYKELESRHQSRIRQLEEGYVKKMTDLKQLYELNRKQANHPDSSNDATSSDSQNWKQSLELELDSLTKECDYHRTQLNASFHSTVQQLLDSYDEYLSAHSPLPSFLPVYVTISIPSKGISLKKVVIKPADNSFDVKRLVEKRLEDIGNPINKALSSKDFFVYRHGDKEEEINDEYRPLSLYNILQGEELLLMGTIHLKSDLPKQCFTAIYEKGKDQSMDYFSCKECNSNWICRPCAENCHSGHSLSEHILNHRPTWACCYCVKNKKCKIDNIKRKEVHTE